MKRYACLDLFSGAGGMALGFSSVKCFNILLSIDNNKKFSQTYIHNFKETEHIDRDITSFSEDEIKGINKKYDIDVIIGGPPCQGFSLAGNIGRLEKKDSRNLLFLSYIKFVKNIRPKIFIMENVANLARHKKGETLKVILNEFKKIGYQVKWEILNASEYGVPQNRKRIFIVGSKKNIDKFIFPEKMSKNYSVMEAIGDLPKLKSGEVSDFPNHVAMSHSEQMLKKMMYVKDGGNKNDIPMHLRPKSGDARKYIRYDSRKVSIPITGDMRKVFHYEQNRALTARELARLQSFPDSFIFYGNSIDIQQQIGNAVPPLLAKKIALCVEEFLNEQ